MKSFLLKLKGPSRGLFLECGPAEHGSGISRTAPFILTQYKEFV